MVFICLADEKEESLPSVSKTLVCYTGSGSFELLSSFDWARTVGRLRTPTTLVQLSYPNAHL